MFAELWKDCYPSPGLIVKQNQVNYLWQIENEGKDRINSCIPEYSSNSVLNLSIACEYFPLMMYD